MGGGDKRQEEEGVGSLRRAGTGAAANRGLRFVEDGGEREFGSGESREK